MAYLGATELAGLLPNVVGTISGSSMPITMGEVATFCERASIELDSAAAIGGYVVPIASTATQAYAQMALYTSWGAACLTLRTIFPAQGGPGDQMPTAEHYCEDFQNVLSRLRDKIEVLVGAPVDTSGQYRSLGRSYAVTNPLATSGVTPPFRVGDVF